MRAPAPGHLSAAPGDLRHGRRPPVADVAKERIAAPARAPARARSPLAGPSTSASYSSRVSAIIPTVVPIGTVSAARHELVEPTRALGFDLGRRLLGLELETAPARSDLFALGDEPPAEEDILGIGTELRHDHRMCGHRLGFLVGSESYGLWRYAPSGTSTSFGARPARRRAQASPIRLSGIVSVARWIRPATACSTTSVYPRPRTSGGTAKFE